MNFLDYLKCVADEINQGMDDYFVKQQQAMVQVSTKLLPLVSNFIDVDKGGKRLRGALVKLGFQLSGSSPTSEILKPALAYELFQTAILAHDDIIDESPLRRGKPTLYRVLGGKHYGISQTICLGDLGFFLGAKLITDSSFAEDKKNKALSIYCQMVISTVLGEMLDVELPYLKSGKEEDVLVIHKLKTAFYTIVYPLQIGLVLGGAKPHLLDNVAKFGEALGIAFQIQDDILGVFGDEKTLGKSVTSDIEEGKITLLYLYALEKGTAKQKEVLEKYYGQGKITTKELEQIKEIFVSTGASEYSKQKADFLVTEAKEIIKVMETTEDNKNLLNQMADFLVKRDK